jgi:hypothetical protein
LAIVCFFGWDESGAKLCHAGGRTMALHFAIYEGIISYYTRNERYIALHTKMLRSNIARKIARLVASLR